MLQQVCHVATFSFKSAYKLNTVGWRVKDLHLQNSKKPKYKIVFHYLQRQPQLVCFDCLKEKEKNPEDNFKFGGLHPPHID